jgi:hypothetical protein
LHAHCVGSQFEPPAELAVELQLLMSGMVIAGPEVIDPGMAAAPVAGRRVPVRADAEAEIPELEGVRGALYDRLGFGRLATCGWKACGVYVRRAGVDICGFVKA